MAPILCCELPEGTNTLAYFGQEKMIHNIDVNRADFSDVVLTCKEGKVEASKVVLVSIL
jgi:hypothetical protein